ncbi:hypothetical protein KKG56_01600, partial [bacterium]|nr:hypothetical protein [bacterium]
MNKVVNNIKAYVIVMVLAVMGFVTNSWAIGGLYDGIMVTPYYGTVGISATLTTNNDIAFDSNEQVRIDFGTIQSLTTVTADTEGNFLLPFTIPIHNAGIATITATGLSSMRATTTTFAVLNLSITPVTGTVGTIITVTGEGYTDDEYIIIFFGTSSLNPITSTYANTAGSFSTTFTANFQSSSTVNVKAKGSSDRLANTTFYLPDQLIIEPDATTVKAGEIVTYTAIARSSVGGSWTVTDNTTFGIDNTIAGSMTTHGIFTASKVGTWTVTGTYTALVDTALVTVIHGTATTFSIAPAAATVTAGEQVVYTATATDACANEWNATGETAFSVNDSWGSMTTQGTYTAGMVGNWIVKGTHTPTG